VPPGTGTDSVRLRFSLGRRRITFAENTAEKQRILSDPHGKRPTGSRSNRIVLTGCMATLRVHFMRGGVEAAFFNPLERLNGEIKRRSDVVGIFFPTKMPLCDSSEPPARTEPQMGGLARQIHETGNDCAFER
jgi:hypothetical protein